MCRTTLAIAVSIAAATFLTACSGSPTASVTPGAAAVRPQLWLQAQAHSSGATRNSLEYATAVKELAVSDPGAVVGSHAGAVDVLNGHYVQTGSITAGISSPGGDDIDRNGNLYVANNFSNVTEYNRTGNLIFTYGSGLVDPSNVAVDRSGNVFVADMNGPNQPGNVVEYHQGSNTAVASCATGLANEGVAVKGVRVFVSGNNPNSGVGNIVEYAKGLSGCQSSVLGATVGNAGGMQIDRSLKLIVCDQASATINIIAPPYSSISSSFLAGYDPANVALNRRQNTVFVADPVGADVLVFSYPSGSFITSIRATASGPTDPQGAATYTPRRT